MALTLLIISASEVSLLPCNVAPSKGTERPWTGDRTPSQHLAPICSYVLWYSTSLSIALSWDVVILKHNLCVHAVISCQCTYVIWFKGCFKVATVLPSQRPLLLLLNTQLRLELYTLCSKEIGLLLLHTLFQNNLNKFSTTNVKLPGVDILQNC